MAAPVVEWDLSYCLHCMGCIYGPTHNNGQFVISCRSDYYAVCEPSEVKHTDERFKGSGALVE